MNKIVGYTLILGLGGLLLRTYYKDKKEFERKTNIENHLRKNFYLVIDQRNNLEKELINEKTKYLGLYLKEGLLENENSRLLEDNHLLINEYLELGEKYKNSMKNNLKLINENTGLRIEVEVQKRMNESLRKNNPTIPYSFSGEICSK